MLCCCIFSFVFIFFIIGVCAALRLHNPISVLFIIFMWLCRKCLGNTRRVHREPFVPGTISQGPRMLTHSFPCSDNVICLGLRTSDRLNLARIIAPLDQVELRLVSGLRYAPPNAVEQYIIFFFYFLFFFPFFRS